MMLQNPIARNRPVWLLAAWAVVCGTALVLTGCGGGQSSAQSAAGAKEKTLYTCGMHPQVVQAQPGNCPICGMKLTPIRKQDSAAGAAAESPAISVDPVTTQTMGIRTAIVTRGPLRRTVRTVGAIDY